MASFFAGQISFLSSNQQCQMFTLTPHRFNDHFLGVNLGWLVASLGFPPLVQKQNLWR